MNRGLAAIAGVLAAGALGVSARAQTHPDLTGVWSTPFRIHSSGLPLLTGGTPWMPASMDVHSYKIMSLDELSQIADRSVAEHHGIPLYGQPRPPPPALNAAGRAAMAALTYEKGEARALSCAPGNAIDRAPGSPLQIVQGARAVALMTEGGAPGRTIFLDDRSQANAIPQWNGLSVGHWEGRTLVVHTVAIRGDGFGMFPRLPMDENADLTERYTLQPDGKTLDVLATVTDPTLYTEPMHKLVHLASANDVLVTDYTCVEGKDDMIEMTVKPGDDPAAKIYNGGAPPGGPPPPRPPAG